ncbi:MAG: hypothetical protein JRI64_07325 [Deltaproteobacteria bacterium]|nr:hypothetical protein [Deltaproteobacteria bacterium]
MVLVRKNFEQPALLEPSDLQPVRKIVGECAIDYTLIIGGFHFINRIADLLDVSPEALPRPLRKFEFLRRLTVRMASFMMARMDLDNREFQTSYEDALRDLTPVFKQALGKDPGDEFESVRPRPKLIEVFQLSMEERDVRSSLDHETVARVHRTVEKALPRGIDETEGFHERPGDPVEAFAFVGTRYAYRTSSAMINALRQEGFDDEGIMDLAIAVAEANQWARIHRLLGLKPELFFFQSDRPGI